MLYEEKNGRYLGKLMIYHIKSMKSSTKDDQMVSKLSMLAAIKERRHAFRKRIPQSTGSKCIRKTIVCCRKTFSVNILHFNLIECSQTMTNSRFILVFFKSRARSKCAQNAILVHFTN